MKNLAYSFVVLFVAVFSFESKAQEYIYIEQDTITVLPFNFYVKKVDDKRFDKVIGHTLTDGSRRSKEIRVKGGFSSELQSYMRLISPRSEGKQPVLCRIKEFKILERAEGSYKIGELYARVEFYLYEELGLYMVYSNDYILQSNNPDPKQIHEENIKKFVKLSLVDFYHNYEVQDNIVIER